MKNSSVRLVVYLTIIAVTTTVLLSFLYDFFANKIYLLILLVFVVDVIEIVLFTLFNYNVSQKPLRKIIESTKKITKGEYIQTNNKILDKDLRELSTNINNTAYEFENLEQMRKSFLSNASHELRSPLTSMQGFLQAILDGTISMDDSEKYLKIVLRETKRLSSLINSMLDLSRMESGKNPLNPNKFDINTIILQIVERFEPNLDAKYITLETDFVRDFTYVYADKDKIVQVLINLIDNAIKYSPSNSKILITTHIHGKKIYVSVKDSGFGISKKDQLHIWERFYMADKARTPSKNKGTGLGLSIVKQIVEDHKEVIWVESTRGAGATFIFTLTIFDPNKHIVSDAIPNTIS